MGINIKTIDIVGRALGTYQESAKNLIAIGNASRKLAQEKDDLEFKKKEQAIKLEKMQREGNLSELEFNILSAQHKEYMKQQEQVYKGSEAAIQMETHTQQKKADMAKTAVGAMAQEDPESVSAAMQMAKNPRTQLRPKFSYGKVGYELVNLDDEEEKDALNLESKRLTVESKRNRLGGSSSFSEKDVLAEARAMAKEDTDTESTYEQKMRKYIPTARDLLSGKETSSEVTQPKVKSNKSSQFDEATEARIQRNIEGFGRRYSREQIIEQMKKKGLIK